MRNSWRGKSIDIIATAPTTLRRWVRRQGQTRSKPIRSTDKNIIIQTLFSERFGPQGERVLFNIIHNESRAFLRGVLNDKDGNRLLSAYPDINTVLMAAALKRSGIRFSGMEESARQAQQRFLAILDAHGIHLCDNIKKRDAAERLQQNFQAVSGITANDTYSNEKIVGICISAVLFAFERKGLFPDAKIAEHDIQ